MKSTDSITASMTLTLQEFIFYHGYEALKEFGVNIKPHPEYTELVHLSISKAFGFQFMENKFVRQCRGSVVNKENGSFACRPFDKFFNYGESLAEPIDLSGDIKLQKKYDGSLINVWRYGGKLNVSTTGSPDGGGNVGDFGMTFSQLFWNTVEQSGWSMEDLIGDNDGMTFSFELETPFNQIVVRHESPKVTLLSMRVNRSGEEIIPHPLMVPRGCQVALSNDAPSSMEEILKMAEALDPYHQEGFVLLDAASSSGRRVKIKSSDYVRLHHLRGEISSEKAIWESVQMGEVEEISSYFPDVAPLLSRYQEAYNQIIFQAEKLLEENRHLDKKGLAMKIIDEPTKAVVFALYDNKFETANDFLHQMRPQHLSELAKKTTGFDPTVVGDGVIKPAPSKLRTPEYPIRMQYQFDPDNLDKYKGCQIMVITRGLPGSGKTTESNKVARKINAVNINRDDMRAMTNMEFSKDREALVTSMRNSLIRSAFESGKSVIISDTNLNPNTVKDLIDQCPPEVLVLFWDEFLFVSNSVCKARNSLRTDPVPEKAMKQFIGMRDALVFDERLHDNVATAKVQQERGGSKLQSAYIFDVDGTLSMMTNRGPYEWWRVGDDSVNLEVVEVLRSLDRDGHNIIITSGRDSACRTITEEWLDANEIPYDYLLMRETGDSRSDVDIKRELYYSYVEDKYVVRGVFDDRDSVVALWRSLGLTCFQVNYGDF